MDHQHVLPDRLTPRSPSSVRSPAGSSAKSWFKAHASMTALYCAGCIGRWKTTLSRSEAGMIQGTWLQ
jgi:hypothetical protein